MKVRCDLKVSYWAFYRPLGQPCDSDACRDLLPSTEMRSSFGAKRQARKIAQDDEEDSGGGVSGLGSQEEGMYHP